MVKKVCGTKNGLIGQIFMNYEKECIKPMILH